MDDSIVTINRVDDVKLFKQKMSNEFDMSELRLLSYYHGIEVSQHKEGITLKQTVYAKSILEKPGMIDCNPHKYPMKPRLELIKDEQGVPVDPTFYRSIVSGLKYLTHIRPYIAFSVGMVSRLMERPTSQHL